MAHKESGSSQKVKLARNSFTNLAISVFEAGFRETREKEIPNLAQQQKQYVLPKTHEEDEDTFWLEEDKRSKACFAFAFERGLSKLVANDAKSLSLLCANLNANCKVAQQKDLQSAVAAADRFLLIGGRWWAVIGADAVRHAV